MSEEFAGADFSRIFLLLGNSSLMMIFCVITAGILAEARTILTGT